MFRHMHQTIHYHHPLTLIISNILAHAKTLVNRLLCVYIIIYLYYTTTVYNHFRRPTNLRDRG
jgi:hypothetical protein